MRVVRPEFMPVACKSIFELIRLEPATCVSLTNKTSTTWSRSTDNSRIGQRPSPSWPHTLYDFSALP